MASSGKRKTTMAKLNREQRLRERKMEKQHRKETRKDDDPAVVEEVEDLSHLDRYVDPFSAAELPPAAGRGFQLSRRPAPLALGAIGARRPMLGDRQAARRRGRLDVLGRRQRLQAAVERGADARRVGLGLPARSPAKSSSTDARQRTSQRSKCGLRMPPERRCRSACGAKAPPP